MASAPPASQNFRASFFKHATMSNTGNGSAEPSENTHLLSRMTTTDSGTPYYKSDNRAVRWPFMVFHLTWEIFKTNYVNVLLVFVPLGIIAGMLEWSPVLQFTLNFIAIIPLASLLAFATEELAVPLGQTLGGLLNATFGNAVELIVRLRIRSFRQKLTLNRSASSPCATMKSALSKPACSAASCPTSSSFWAVASSQAASNIESKASIRLLLRPCRLL